MLLSLGTYCVISTCGSYLIGAMPKVGRTILKDLATSCRCSDTVMDRLLFLILHVGHLSEEVISGLLLDDFFFFARLRSALRELLMQS